MYQSHAKIVEAKGWRNHVRKGPAPSRKGPERPAKNRPTLRRPPRQFHAPVPLGICDGVKRPIGELSRFRDFRNFGSLERPIMTI
jgi:hypothetical protein